MSENTQDTRSEVERMWETLSGKFGVHRNWHNLHPMEQMQVIQALNSILSILHD